MDGLDFREILTKKPFFIITADRPATDIKVIDKRNTNLDETYDNATFNILTQNEMLRQYYPSGHKINNNLIYPDVLKQDPETKRWYVQKITRTALGFQQVIALKHLIHIIGNDVQFELSEEEKKNVKKKSDDIMREGNKDIFVIEEDTSVKLLNQLKYGWSDMKAELAWFDAVNSYLITAELCIVGYIGKNNTHGLRVFSYRDGDMLYPHYDNVTGELSVFARKYYDYDDDGVKSTEWVEVWDDTYYYRAKRGTAESSTFVKIKEFFGLNGFAVVEQKRHGFSKIPVAYYRNEDGPCWINAQTSIEQLEEALSYFFENNKAFAFPILVMTGEGIELKGDENGSVKAISIDSPEGKAEFLDHHDISTSYNTLLTKFYDLIYEQSFTVKPPELKSGDLPGVALKLLYSPAIECAISDAQKLQGALDKLVWIVKFCTGLKENNQASLLALGVNAWIEPYVHQNDTELVTNLSQSVQNNILSLRTASERNSKFSKNDEYTRIVREMKEKALLDVEAANLKQTHVTNESIREKKIEAGFSGQDVNTGGGGHHVNETDENGNRPNENNWDEYNQNRFN